MSYGARAPIKMQLLANRKAVKEAKSMAAEGKKLAAAARTAKSKAKKWEHMISSAKSRLQRQSPKQMGYASSWQRPPRLAWLRLFLVVLQGLSLLIPPTCARRVNGWLVLPLLSLPRPPPYISLPNAKR
jgi:hypothetical protein